MKKLIKAIMITGFISMISFSMKAQESHKLVQPAIVKPPSDVKPTSPDNKPVAMIPTSNITPAAKTVQQDKGMPKIATPPMPTLDVKPLAMQVPTTQANQPVNMDRPKNSTINTDPRTKDQQSKPVPMSPIVSPMKPMVAEPPKSH